MRRAYKVGGWLVEPELNSLSRDAKLIHLEPKVMEVCAYLVSRAGGVVSKEELIRTVWPDIFVTDDVLTRAISELRKAFGDDPKCAKYIETIPKRGYRLVAPVENLEQSPVSVSRGSSPRISSKAVVVGLVALVLAVALIWWSRHGSKIDEEQKITSIVILPLANLSSDPEQEYFVDGMHEALVTEMSKISALRVISRTSVMQYKSTAKSVAEIARELHVDAVIQGSVLRSGDRVRVTVRLLAAAPERHLWVASYDRSLSDVLVLTDDIARAVAHQIRAAITPADKARLAAARPVDPGAHELYVKGRYQHAMYTPETVKKAVVYFQRAIQKDPTYAPAHASLGMASYDLSVDLNPFRFQHSQPLVASAKASIKRALELDPTLAEAHTALGWIKLDYDFDWHGAEEAFRLALDENPNSADAHHGYAFWLNAMGRSHEAVIEMKRALQLDPLSPVVNGAMISVFIQAREYDEAINQAQNMAEMFPSQCKPYYDLGLTYSLMGWHEKAIAAMQTALKLADPGEVPNVRAKLAYVCARAGRRREALRLLQELNTLSKPEGISPILFARVYVGLGRNGEALSWLEKAFSEHVGALDWLKTDPVFDPLRSDARFQDLLLRMNFPQQETK